MAEVAEVVVVVVVVVVALIKIPNNQRSRPIAMIPCDGRQF